MVHGKNRIPYRIDRKLTSLAGPDYDATISFGLPFEPEDSQYGKYRLRSCHGPRLSVKCGARMGLSRREHSQYKRHEILRYSWAAVLKSTKQGQYDAVATSAPSASNSQRVAR